MSYIYLLNINIHLRYLKDDISSDNYVHNHLDLDIYHTYNVKAYIYLNMMSTLLRE